MTGCEAKSFWILARHGTRNPGDDDILLMASRLREIQAEVVLNHESGSGNELIYIQLIRERLVKLANILQYVKVTFLICQRYHCNDSKVLCGSMQQLLAFLLPDPAILKLSMVMRLFNGTT